MIIFLLPCPRLGIFRFSKFSVLNKRKLSYARHLSALQCKQKQRKALIYKSENNRNSWVKLGNVVSCNSTITGYCQEGRVEDARHVFDRMPQRDVVSWTAMLTGYAQNGRMDEARTMFNNMPERNVVSWNAMIKGCIQNGRIEEAFDLFNKMPQRNRVSWTTMIAGFGVKGKTEDARHLFDRMPERDLVSWNAMINAYVENGRMEDAQVMFDKMPKRNVITWTTMVSGYSQIGRMKDARYMFDKMTERNVISWTAMIAGYAQNGHGDKALRLFLEMQQTSVKPNLCTLTSGVNACACLAILEHGYQVHALTIIMGFDFDVILQNSLITMYAKCGSTDDAQRVFEQMTERDMVSWNAMLAGHTQNGRMEDAHHMFDRMPDRDVFSWTTMISGYFQSYRIDEACCLFERMPNQDVVSWTAMISGYEQTKQGEEALKLFVQMQRTGMKPIQPTFTSAISALASLVLLGTGQQVHAHIVKSEFELDVCVNNSVIAMYGKCGSMGDAVQVFDKMPERDVVSWNSLIVGFAQHGHGKVVLELIEQFEQTGLEPNGITFLGVLSACSHAGLVNEGWQYFNSMIRQYCITPRADHYACMVDLLARAGLLNEALDFIHKMPFKPHAAVWGALLGSCKIHSNVDLAKYAADQLFELEPQNATSYVVLSNMYALAGRWDDEAKIRTMKKEKMVSKVPGYSWIEIHNRVHTFIAGDILHS